RLPMRLLLEHRDDGERADDGLLDDERDDGDGIVEAPLPALPGDLFADAREARDEDVAERTLAEADGGDLVGVEALPREGSDLIALAEVDHEAERADELPREIAKVAHDAADRERMVELMARD